MYRTLHEIFKRSAESIICCKLYQARTWVAIMAIVIAYNNAELLVFDLLKQTVGIVSIYYRLMLNHVNMILVLVSSVARQNLMS